MPWLELKLRLRTAEVERAEDCLTECGALAVTLRDAGDEPLLEPAPGDMPLWSETVLTALFDDGTDLTAVRQQLKLAGFTSSDELSAETLADQAWERTWMSSYTTMRFGERLWIVPSHLPLPEQQGAVALKLDPGLAFGTGTHATTALCLEYLDAHPPSGNTVLDYGCGSGVLALAAAKLGARRVYALDYDPQALTATADNMQRNDVPPERLRLIGHEASPDEPVDLILANILASALIELAPRLKRLVKPKGRIVLSGILAEQVPEVARAYGWDHATTQLKDGWALLHSNP